MTEFLENSLAERARELDKARRRTSQLEQLAEQNKAILMSLKEQEVKRAERTALFTANVHRKLRG